MTNTYVGWSKSKKELEKNHRYVGFHKYYDRAVEMGKQFRTPALIVFSNNRNAFEIWILKRHRRR
jgi:hypothetical protein